MAESSASGATPVASQPKLPAVTPKLAVENVSVTYISRDGDRVHAVDDVSFTITDKPGVGEIVVILGPSGCGKSTLLKCIAGLHQPDQGRVLVDSKVVDGPSRERGMVFQQYTSFAWLTVQRNVEYGLRLHGVPAAERHAKAQKVLEQVGLADFARRYPKALSGGMKQRVAIARTLVNEPRLVLMDEPFGALDPQTRWSMQSLILDISRRLDNTIVFVTHDVSEAVYLADTIFILSQRPAKILHRIEVPHFTERTPALKQTDQFRRLENQVLDLLHGQAGGIVLG
ncbi:MAG: ABC transporter ATP-binding protein [Deltaproteobacteria bacterium]|nr:ABC transporter ATP-binding protein [Deltaproteobacteria bacterium]